MNSRIVAIASLVALLGINQAAQAQRILDTRMGGVALSGLIGGAANTDLQRIAGPEGAAAAPLRRITADTSPVLAGAVGIWPSQFWGFRIQGSFAPTRLEIREPREDGLVDESNLVRSNARLWTADLSFMIRAPVTPGRRIVPYLIIGGGVIGFQADHVGAFAVATGHELDSRSVEPAGVIGLGAHVPLQRHNLALTFELTDHIFTTPIENSASADIGEDVEVSNHVRLVTGLTLRLK